MATQFLLKACFMQSVVIPAVVLSLLGAACRQKRSDYMLKATTIEFNRGYSPGCANILYTKAYDPCFRYETYSLSPENFKNPYADTNLWLGTKVKVKNLSGEQFAGLMLLLGGQVKDSKGVLQKLSRVEYKIGEEYTLSDFFPPVVQALEAQKLQKRPVQKAEVWQNFKPFSGAGSIYEVLRNDLKGLSFFAISGNTFEAEINKKSIIANKFQENSIVNPVIFDASLSSDSLIREKAWVEYRTGDIFLFHKNRISDLIHTAILVERDLFFHEIETPEGPAFGFVTMEQLLKYVETMICGNKLVVNNNQNGLECGIDPQKITVRRQSTAEFMAPKLAFAQFPDFKWGGEAKFKFIAAEKSFLVRAQLALDSNLNAVILAPPKN